MTKEQIKRVFSTFQNLNLLALIEDLRRDLVARGDWQVGEALCPVAHGWERGLVYCPMRMNPFELAGFGAVYSQIRIAVGDFVDWWDNTPYEAPRELIETLEEIYEERLADADAVQEMLDTAVLEEVLA